MCWNEKISFATFFLAVSTTMIATYLGSGPPPSYLLFLLVFSSIQAVEGMYWSRMVNPYIASHLIIITLFALNMTLLHHMRPIFWRECMGIMSIWLILAFYSTWGERVRVASNGHLDWPLTRHLPLVIMWMLIYFYPPLMTRRWVFLSFNILIVSMSLFTYCKDRTFGSMWCWFSNISYVIMIVRLLFLNPFLGCTA